MMAMGSVVGLGGPWRGRRTGWVGSRAIPGTCRKDERHVLGMSVPAIRGVYRDCAAPVDASAARCSTRARGASCNHWRCGVNGGVRRGADSGRQPSGVRLAASPRDDKRDTGPSTGASLLARATRGDKARFSAVASGRASASSTATDISSE